MTQPEEKTLYPIYTYEDYREKQRTVFENYGKKMAIACVGDNAIEREITYGELLDIANKINAFLLGIGLRRAQRVAVISPPTAEAVVLNMALAYGGYTNVLIDATLPSVECDKLLRYADASAIFVTEAIYNQIDTELKKEIPSIRMNNSFEYVLFDGCATEGKKTNVEPYDEEVAAIVFSSGTTAEMKGIMVTYSSILYAQKYICKYANLSNKDKFLDILPSNHIAGYSSSMSCLLTGTEVGFITEFNAEKMLLGFKHFAPTDFIMVPRVYEVIKSKMEAAINQKPFLVKWYAKTVMKVCGSVRRKTGINLRFLTKPIWKPVFGQKMRLCGCGTLPCPEEIIRFYLDLGMEFTNVYGATETGFPITAANCNEKYPLKGAGNVKQFEEIDIRICEPDEEGIGEIRLKTPLIMKGYYRDAELTKQSFDEEGYFKTGDLGYIDEEGYLYITGRSKEAIVLHNGKKVSPIDVDKYYQKGAKDMLLASCGISTSEGYDSIYLFVEKDKHTEEEVSNAILILEKMSQNASLYRVERVLTVDKIPVTPVGKVKRFMLKKYVDNESSVLGEKGIKNEEEFAGNNQEEILLKLITKYVPEKVVTLESNIKRDLDIDSLSMFELGMDIENKLGIDVVNHWESLETVEDILYKYVNSKDADKSYVISDFPLKRTREDLRYIKFLGKVTRAIYKSKVVGVENIPKDENILFCPNHESYFDAMWVASALEREGFDMSGFCCLAAEHLKDKVFMKRAFKALGGIPVDRSGNTAPAMKRAEELLNQDKTYMIIHPEGTRSRSGKLGEFKLGAAQLAKDVGIKIVPVCINGAYEIYPPKAKLPHCFNWKKWQRYPLTITFGKAIEVGDKTKEEITEQIKNFIVEQKMEK